jgi:hypothetical protein
MSNRKFVETEFQFGKNIFDYVLDNSMYINKDECNDYTPPFITYVPGGIINIDAENQLRGMNSKTYQSPNPSLAQYNDIFKYEKESWSKKECKTQILPNGYFKHIN